MNRSRILLAVLPASIAAHRAALESVFEVHAVDTLDAAFAALAVEQYDAVVCGVHFSDSQMPLLLQRCKETATMRDLPFFCIRAIRGSLPEVMYGRLCDFVTGMGGDYFDFQSLEMQAGYDAAAAVLRERIVDRLRRQNGQNRQNREGASPSMRASARCVEEGED